MGKGRLAKLDLSKKFESKEEYEDAVLREQLRLLTLQQKLIVDGGRAIGVFEGWDAAGKGGAIKRLTEKLDPRHFRVYPVGPPTDVERANYYFWRFWTRLPQRGEIALFDRSWYGRVLVERVEGFATKHEWKRAYREINEFEKMLTDDGVPIGKYFLYISKKEQLARFRERQTSPFKKWKIGPDDWRNRKKWSAYVDAAEEMFDETDTKHAPWHVVAAEHKWWARVDVLHHFVKTAASAVGRPKTLRAQLG
jgi:polyphosphate kinase 2 (PPK2 family)